MLLGSLLIAAHASGALLGGAHPGEAAGAAPLPGRAEAGGGAAAGARALGEVRAPATMSVARACRPCYCEYYSQDCAGDGLRCVGEERVLRGRIRVEGYSADVFNFQLCGYDGNNSANSCNCPCLNTANLLLEQRPLPTDPISTSCPICSAASLLMEAMPAATQMKRWLTWRNARIKSRAVRRGNANDGYFLESDVYVHTQRDAAPCVAAEWLELQRQLDVHYGRAFNYSRLRNSSKADAAAWVAAYEKRAREVAADAFVTYKPRKNPATGVGGLDILEFKLSIVSPMAQVFTALPCTRESHLFCNAAARTAHGGGAAGAPARALAALATLLLAANAGPAALAASAGSAVARQWGSRAAARHRRRE